MLSLLGLDELNELPGHAHRLFVATRIVRLSDEPLRATPKPNLRERKYVSAEGVATPGIGYFKENRAGVM